MASVPLQLNNLRSFHGSHSLGFSAACRPTGTPLRHRRRRRMRMSPISIPDGSTFPTSTNAYHLGLHFAFSLSPPRGRSPTNELDRRRPSSDDGSGTWARATLGRRERGGGCGARRGRSLPPMITLSAANSSGAAVAAQRNSNKSSSPSDVGSNSVLLAFAIESLLGRIR